MARNGRLFHQQAWHDTMMIDPLLKNFDMPVMIEYPIKTEEVPGLDAVLVTHADNDHYSVPTTNDLAEAPRHFTVRSLSAHF